ncbi:rCG22483, isoform CRA_b [Rattus norvegicus]|uniref:RCG22483, isoform CRA_b n=1 Tax=Rattus norvegicus TaxID=10116 RepID=A6INL7_RAT|nr:rCG22483, isoform CRA_b [Rattus norvegicus]
MRLAFTKGSCDRAR